MKNIFVAHSFVRSTLKTDASDTYASSVQQLRNSSSLIKQPQNSHPLVNIEEPVVLLAQMVERT